jgi:ABC-type multidrug transport system ATPase subunit
MVLQDVIALRKASGKVTGEVRLNGHLQEKKTFRRCSGYVEQFDIQSPELTVRETILFSAYLRLEHFITDYMKVKFVDQIIEILELGPIRNDVVGTDEEGGLSFEERKRLSIAVELAASPSIIFLDEVRVRLQQLGVCCYVVHFLVLRFDFLIV